MIIPAFDLINGEIVRLYKGNFFNRTKYDINLYKRLKDYEIKGVKKIHLVDLDGAKNIKDRQIKVFRDIISYTNIPIQIGGGIRNEEDINMFLNLGVKKVVIGSSAIKNKTKVKKWLKIYGPNVIILALDIIIKNNNKEIAIHGWQETTNITLEEIIEYFSPIGLKHVLCTDISKDGTLSGPNNILYKDIVKKFKHISFQASGGVSRLKDLLSLKKTGVKSVIIGRSLLENKFTIEEALKCWQSE
ncbi:1-(5-phosphoribosyl)-5-[(5-phosphoribosylamino)methylideneamino]imidazole-4-carboxamide isomerase [Buchnera aphidicola]|jgi:phosphoribosylformimino-5-aminoimidazole carboxamide ribotide isomerase|uniref:1-(5-phosphoribosyl)-5-[(5-phosphoribosylamino)methylideneamino] imidazole-4-carboxamide isomerase n=1 Tax=Buchnera aphidicola subsp. Schizaphis graminum (strain Sg) TaxID=198804 RepID=HIS4_BUCAP|nr:1-(5-phosphoribosyl)-5-[(5-phosphoribosylamino)methylideneamino]imidazole-4-carboxamide isomerase [Buchnera aphidicola]Q9ZHE2.1 RecName: Full=1-(5-phosphoribosyl)-5-[(5-phosphoribosylamino)methylideneamino] imidazole-4-carboxamide isomerase; AltName: Full=Phosphoribosylformimino-5-aminoimidazole carboxamide ribotide isomerase [Buchnera aphidicola str. Sg (Schizaphis graminum)]AAC97359.1 N-(5'-phospho-L-ribosylformimino)-5-amino-1-(5'-phosphoribosyl)-4-imidazolecarboxamide isomerase [Buchnera a